MHLFQDSASELDHHHHGLEHKQRGPDVGDVAATFVFEEEPEETHFEEALARPSEDFEEALARSTTYSDPTIRSRRPTGMPYVLADQATGFI